MTCPFCSSNATMNSGSGSMRFGSDGDSIDRYARMAMQRMLPESMTPKGHDGVGISPYRSYLMGAVSRIQNNYGDFAPSSFPAHLLYKTDDKTAYEMVNFWRGMTTKNVHQFRMARAHAGGGGSGILNIKIRPSSDGGVEVLNAETFYPVASAGVNGLLSFYGPKEYVPYMGGKENLVGIPLRMEEVYAHDSDGDMLRQRPRVIH